MGCGLSKPRTNNFDDNDAGTIAGPPFSSSRPSAETTARPATSTSVLSAKISLASSGKRPRGEIRKSSISKPILINWSESDFASEGEKSRPTTCATTATNTNSSLRTSIVSRSSTSSFEVVAPIKCDLKGTFSHFRGISAYCKKLWLNDFRYPRHPVVVHNSSPSGNQLFLGP